MAKAPTDVPLESSMSTLARSLIDDYHGLTRGHAKAA
mgnify:CR=1 FL=1